MNMQNATAATPRLKTNLNTDLLKIIAIAAMLVDHIGIAFFPDAGWMRCVGRIAFPIFCYCLTVGLLYTKNFNQYLLRLGLFALISQPFYVLAFNQDRFWEEFISMNIFFTLFVSLLAMRGIQTRRWWLFGLCILALALVNFDYSITGVILMLIFYFCRNKPLLGVALYVLNYLPALLGGGDLASPFTIMLGSYAFNGVFCAVLAVPLIFIAMPKMRLKLSKWFFYGFYPGHLAVIAAIQFFI